MSADSSIEAMRIWKERHLGDMGGDPGPYASSMEAFRHGTRNVGGLCPHLASADSVPLSEYPTWPPVLPGDPIPEPRNANRKHFQFRCDPYINRGDLVGQFIAYDSKNQIPWGVKSILNAPNFTPPARDGLRDNGFHGVAGAAWGGPSFINAGDISPRIFDPARLACSYSLQFRTRQTGNGVSPLLGASNTDATTFFASGGVGMYVWRTRSLFGVTFGGGTTGDPNALALNNNTGPNVPLSNNTIYTAVWGYTRTPGTGGGTFDLRIYTAVGALVKVASVTTSVGVNEHLDAPWNPHRIIRSTYDKVTGFGGFRVFPGVNYASPANAAIADAMGDNTVQDPNDDSSIWITGVRTGIYDLADPDRLIYSGDGTSTMEMRAFSRRCRWADENEVSP